MPGRAPRLHLPFAEWPLADRELWAVAEESNDPFSELRRNQLAASSRKQYVFAWRRFLGFLKLYEPSALGVAPADRLTMSRVRAYVAHLAETNTPRSLAIQTDALYKGARHVLPSSDLNWFKGIKARLHATAPTTGKARPILTSVQLLDLGQQLMDECQAAADQPITMVDAIKFRDGLMIALFAFVPLRRKNLAAMQIGRHLVQQGDDYFLVFPSSETKTGAPIDFAIPALLDPYMRVYLDCVRLRMLRNPSNSVWVSAKGCALSYSAIWDVITRHTEARLGIRIAPHDVRDAAATMWALAMPAHIGIARDLLSHSNLRTTIKHYNRANGVAASRTYAQLIFRTRKKARSL
jgi:integrase